jgi:hypothetical protein
VGINQQDLVNMDSEITQKKIRNERKKISLSNQKKNTLQYYQNLRERSTNAIRHYRREDNRLTQIKDVLTSYYG